MFAKVVHIGKIVVLYLYKSEGIGSDARVGPSLIIGFFFKEILTAITEIGHKDIIDKVRLYIT